MKKIIILAILSLIAVNSVYADVGESVSIVQLIANSEKYHGKKVIITGYLNLEFEGNGIYLHKDDYLNSVYKNGLWCNINIVKYEKFNKKYVVIEGVFNANNKGHMGLWSGSIEKITRVWEPIKGKE